MKCGHCGMENDKKAKYCFNCGNKLTDDESGQAEYEIIDKKPEHDDTVHCPNCGSTNIHFVTKQEGTDYDVSNGCCGYIIFGPLGLLCGLASDKKSVTVRKCMKCGHEF